MLFIPKYNPKYYFSSGFEEYEEDNTTCYEVDELILPIISKLNIKGYKTKYSCSGHYFRYDVHNIEFDENNSNNLQNAKVTFYDIGDIENDESWSVPYILFEKTVKELNNTEYLPSGWIVEYLPIDLDDQVELYRKYGSVSTTTRPTKYEYRIGLYYKAIDNLIKRCRKEDKEVDIYKYYTKVVNVMKKLYDWCNSLDNYKEEN